MDNTIYFKHSLIINDDKDAVERELNFIYSQSIKIISINITPYRLTENCYAVSGYDICYSYVLEN